MPSSTVVIFQLKQLEENVRMKDREYSELTSKKNEILVNHGKLQQEAEVANNSSFFFAFFLLYLEQRSTYSNNITVHYSAHSSLGLFVLQRHKSNIEQRDSMISEQSKTFQFKGTALSMD